MFKERKKNGKEALIEFKGKAAVYAAKRLASERKMLLSGKRPESIFPDTQQRTAARLLSGFFAMMLVFTILSGIAADLTVAKVKTDTVKAGVLARRYTIPGTLEARDTLDIVLPGNLRISGWMVQAGDRVSAGDELLKLDPDHIRTMTEQLENEITILNLENENLSDEIPGEDTEMLQLAENNLRYAQEDYAQLAAALEAAGIQVEKDLKDAQSKYDQELADLEQAKVQAKEEGIKTAEDDLGAAEKALGDAEYGRAEAVAAARKALSEAENSYLSAQDTYDRAAGELAQAEEALREAEEILASLGENASEEEYNAALEGVNAAQSQKELAQAQADAAAGDLSETEGALAWARENLERIRKRQEELVSEAGDEVRKAEDRLNQKREQTDFSEESLVSSAMSGADAARRELNAAMREWENAGLTGEEQTIKAKRAIETAAIELESAEAQLERAKRSDAVLRREKEAEQMRYEAELQQKQSTLEQIKLFGMQDGIITAPVDGTVKSVTESLVTQDNGAVLTLSRADRGFQFIAGVEQGTAQQLSTGDIGQLFYTIDGSARSVQVRISSIGVPSADGQVRVTAWPEEGDFSSGIAGTLELEKNSGRYQAVLPVSALRSAGGKTIVLVVREKRSVLGTEQTVEEADVVVREQNMENAAVEGVFFPEDQIVIQASKPIRKGDRVRVEN